MGSFLVDVAIIALSSVRAGPPVNPEDGTHFRVLRSSLVILFVYWKNTSIAVGRCSHLDTADL